jgi:hypothetical protein
LNNTGSEDSIASLDLHINYSGYFVLGDWTLHIPLVLLLLSKGLPVYLLSNQQELPDFLLKFENIHLIDIRGLEKKEAIENTDTEMIDVSELMEEDWSMDTSSFRLYQWFKEKANG